MQIFNMNNQLTLIWYNMWWFGSLPDTPDVTVLPTQLKMTSDLLPSRNHVVGKPCWRPCYVIPPRLFIGTSYATKSHDESILPRFGPMSNCRGKAIRAFHVNLNVNRKLSLFSQTLVTQNSIFYHLHCQNNPYLIRSL